MSVISVTSDPTGLTAAYVLQADKTVALEWTLPKPPIDESLVRPFNEGAW